MMKKKISQMTATEIANRMDRLQHALVRRYGLDPRCLVEAVEDFWYYDRAEILYAKDFATILYGICEEGDKRYGYDYGEDLKKGDYYGVIVCRGIETVEPDKNLSIFLVDHQDGAGDTYYILRNDRRIVLGHDKRFAIVRSS